MSFLGLSKEEWQFVNSFSDWVAAVGTVAAVITSLYLARASQRLRLRVYAGHRIIVGGQKQENYPEFLTIGVVNKGSRVATVDNVGWRVGFFRKQHMIQVVTGGTMSSPLPVTLGDGGTAQWLVPLDLEDNWVERFSKDFLLPHWRLTLLTVRLRVFTTVGATFEARLESGLRKKLAEECKRQKALRKS